MVVSMTDINREVKIIDHVKRSLKRVRYMIQLLGKNSSLSSDYVLYRDTIRLLDAERKRLKGKLERLALRQTQDKAVTEGTKNTPFCNSCKEEDCEVSHDETCNMIRKYLKEYKPNDFSKDVKYF